jgi:hypothetical protein
MSMDVLPDGDRAGAQWTADGDPFLTGHAVDRWDERTPAWSVAPETALQDAVRVPELVGWDSFFPKNGDSLYVYLGQADADVAGRPWFAAGFVERGGCVLTTLTPEMLDDAAAAVALLTCAVVECDGGGRP